MKHVIIGTAGHVDHGKTLLVKALTGIGCQCFKICGFQLTAVTLYLGGQLIGLILIECGGRFQLRNGIVGHFHPDVLRQRAGVVIQAAKSNVQ
mgnify:CR=1 FL=1